MAEVLSEDDDNEELIVVEVDPNAEPEQEEAKEEQPAEEPEEEGDEDEDDERMAVSEDDSDEEIVDKNKRNREARNKRREVQKRAKENAKRELEFLRQQNNELLRRMQSLESNAFAQNANTLDSKINEAVEEVRRAELIMARAIEAGNGDDVAAALRIRDEAKARADQLSLSKRQVEQQAKQAAQPQVDPRVTSYAQQWLHANPWYNPNGMDEDSAITKAIDNALAAEGWNPSTEEYWQELTRRVASRIGGDEEPAPRRQAAPRRKAPPTGTTREHAPVSSRKEIYVTPERKAAMIEAGVWDDPVRRNQMLKAYQAYDRDNTAR